MAHTDVRVLPRDDDLVHAELAKLLVETGALEGSIGALRRDDLSREGLERRDHLRPGGALHRVLSPDLQLGVVGVVRVVREDDDPIVLPGMREEPRERLHDRLRPRVRKLAVDEVVQHVHDDQSLH
jgi:hypothetical protein